MLSVRGPLARREPPRHAGQRGEDAGFTLIELVIAMGMMLLVMVVFLELIPPSQQTSNVAQALISNEQNLSVVMGQMAKDIRAANPLDIFDSTVCSTYSISTYNDQIEMNLGPSSGTQQMVMWVYSSSTDTLQREIVSANGCAPTVSSTSWVTSGVTNGTTTPVFTYYDDTGTNLVTSPTSTADNVGNCAVRVAITLDGQNNFSEQLNVWLRDRLPGGMPGCA